MLMYSCKIASCKLQGTAENHRVGKVWSSKDTNSPLGLLEHLGPTYRCLASEDVRPRRRLEAQELQEVILVASKTSGLHE